MYWASLRPIRKPAHIPIRVWEVLKNTGLRLFHRQARQKLGGPQLGRLLLGRAATWGHHRQLGRPRQVQRILVLAGNMRCGLRDGGDMGTPAEGHNLGATPTTWESKTDGVTYSSFSSSYSDTDVCVWIHTRVRESLREVR